VFSLYDTRRGTLATVRPARAGQLRVYACGPDVTRPAHLGDLRAPLLTDLIRRNGERHGLTVIVCQVVPDIGRLAGDGELDADATTDLVVTAGAAGAPPPEGGRSREDAFRADCAALNIAPPAFGPRASESAGPIVRLISALIDSGHAYLGDTGCACFDVSSFADYQTAPDGRSAAADWALWIAAPSAESPAIDGPWGAGVPSWPASCSAASLEYLGTVIDVHTGDIGMRFPHHENERAQSDSVAGHEVVRHWVHCARIRFTGGQLPRPADLAERGLDPLASRLALLSGSYREEIELTWPGLTDADAELRGWREQVADWANEPSRPMCAGYSTRFCAALDDDLDTPSALAALRELAADQEIPAGSKFETFSSADLVLGLDLVSLVGRPRR
jgi:cysteinyl-tRNA synthetase